MLEIYDREKLAEFNGKDGKPAYIAYDGKVYDVTESRLWKMGSHVKKHFAGRDLTDDLSKAPHAAEVFERFTQIGVLTGAKSDLNPQEKKIEMMQELYRKLHPHPMFIHFPMGLLNFTLLMQIIYLFTNNKTFEYAAFYSLVVAFLSIFPTVFSGLFSWWLNFNTAMSKVFKIKIIFSVILAVISGAAVLMRLSDPAGADTLIYNAIIVLNVPVLAVIGFNGGKITWGG